MIGRRIEGQPGLPWVAMTLMITGIVLVTAGLLTGVTPLAIASALPLTLGSLFWLFRRDRPFAASLTEQGIDVVNPVLNIPYTAVQNLRAGGYAYDPAEFHERSCAIEVEHESGSLVIPARLNVQSHELYRFLAAQVTGSGSRDVNPALAEYLENQEATFGSEAIWTCCGVRRKGLQPVYQTLRTFGLGLFLAGLVWAVFGFSGHGEVWQVVGVVIGVFGIVLFLASLAGYLSAYTTVGMRKRASIVIGPQGMAMVQGEIQGVIRWPELLDVRFQPWPQVRSFVVSHQNAAPGILLRVKGADIVISDIYDRPLHVIHRRIRAATGRSVPIESDRAP